MAFVFCKIHILLKTLSYIIEILIKNDVLYNFNHKK